MRIRTNSPGNGNQEPEEGHGDDQNDGDDNEDNNGSNQVSDNFTVNNP